MVSYTAEVRKITMAIFNAESGCIPPFQSLHEIQEEFGEDIAEQWTEIVTHISKLSVSEQVRLEPLAKKAMREMEETPSDDTPLFSAEPFRQAKPVMPHETVTDPIGPAAAALLKAAMQTGWPSKHSEKL